MLNPVVSFLVYLFEMLVSFFLFSSVGGRKKPIYITLIIGVVIYSSGAFINLVFHNSIVINSLYTLMMQAIYALLCFKINPKAALTYSVLMTIFSNALETITVFLISAVFGLNIKAYNTDSVLLFLEISLSKVMYLLSCMALAAVPRGKLPVDKMPFSYYFFPVCVTLTLISFWYLCIRENITDKGQSLLAVLSAGLLGSTILLLIDHRHNEEKSREYLTTKREIDRLQAEKAYYDVLERQNQALMIYAHDAKKHLDAIKNLNTGTQVNEYIDKLSEQLVSYAGGCQSGNKLLDVIINKYATECEMRGISFEYDVRSSNLRGVEDIDLVAIVGNLMDNALTAAEKSRKKSVELYTTWHNRYSVLVISNSCDTAPVSDGARLITTKSESALHGYGIRSVKRTLKKYGGDLDWDYDKEKLCFSMTVMIGPYEEKPAELSPFLNISDH